MDPENSPQKGKEARKRKRDESSPNKELQPGAKKARIMKPPQKNSVLGPLLKLPPEVMDKLKPPTKSDVGAAQQPGSTGSKEPPKESSKDPQTSTTSVQVKKAPKKPNVKSHKAKGPLKPKPIIKKLAPPRPWPNVPVSSNATVPKSSSNEKNHICVTRRSSLAYYLRLCRDLLVKYGYKEVYLSAMGAAIPHAVMLATSLPTILPFDREEIKTSLTTGTVTVMDEVQPVYEDEEGGTQSRDKSTVMIIVRVVDGMENVSPAKGS